MSVGVLCQTLTLRDDEGQSHVLSAIFWGQHQGEGLPEAELDQGFLAQQEMSRLPRLDASEDPRQNSSATQPPSRASSEYGERKSTAKGRSLRRNRSRGDGTNKP